MLAYIYFIWALYIKVRISDPLYLLENIPKKSHTILFSFLHFFGEHTIATIICFINLLTKKIKI